MSARSPAPTPPLRVGLAQISPEKGKVDRNLRRIRESIRSRAGSLDVVVFPEAALSGYDLQGGIEESARTLEEIVRGLGTPPQDGGPDVVLGAYLREGGSLWNAGLHLEPRGDAYRAVHVHRKVFLPTYGLFDEARFLRPGRRFRAYRSRFGPAGILVCEDLWHAPAAAALALDGAHVLFVPAAPPARGFVPGSDRSRSLDRWERRARVVAGEHGVFVVLSQLVGSEGGKLLTGGSLVAAPSGEVLARSPLWDEGVTEVVLDGGDVGRARARGDLLGDLDAARAAVVRSLETAGREPEGEGVSAGGADGKEEAAPTPTSDEDGSAPDVLSGGDPAARPAGAPDPGDRSPLEIDPVRVRDALAFFLRDELRRRGFGRVVVGVSGGLDSAVVLSLAAGALGPDRVRAYHLPYTVTSGESLEHARLMLRRTGVSGETLEITAMVEAYEDIVAEGLSPERRANVQSRLRSMVLFDQAARHDALPLGTGNKSERLLGYFTWHGDDAPPLHPLGDLFKVQVRMLARELDVPEEIVERTPTAELIEGVDDEDELGVAYPEADLILHWVLEGHRPDDLVRRGFDETAVERVVERLEGTHWKRHRPTAAVLSESAIGESYLRPVDY